MNTTNPRVLALCAGYGGLEIAIRAALGGQVVAFAENDPHAAAVFTAHHPQAPNLGDITGADWRTVRDLHRPDVLTAGFPCTDISNAGRRMGIGGKRSGIWKNIVEAVRVLRPRFLFLENVAAIRSRGMDVVAADLAQVGYDARWTCVRAGDPETGAPHQRDRWFALAYPAGTNPERAAHHWHAWDIREPSVGHSHVGRLSLLPTPKASDGPHGGPNQRDTQGHYYLPGLAVRLGTRGPALLPTPKASDGPYDSTGAHNSHGRYYLPGQAVRLDEQWIGHDGADYGPAIHRWERVTGRPAPCPTEPGTRGNRRLAPAFVEWMMGLDQGHVTGHGLPRREELKILGNGVVPQQAHHAYGLLLGAPATRQRPAQAAA